MSIMIQEYLPAKPTQDEEILARREQRLSHVLDNIAARRISVLAVSRKRMGFEPSKLADLLGIETVVAVNGLDALLKASGSLYDYRPVASAIEIESPTGHIPFFKVGLKVRHMATVSALKVLHDAPGQNRLGVVELPINTDRPGKRQGFAIALISQEQRFPIVRDLIREGAGAAAVQMALEDPRIRIPTL